jgi:hypothetical protein
MKSFLEYRTALTGMTVREAMDILKHLGSQDETIIVQNTRGQNHTVCVGEHCQPLPDYMLAIDIHPLLFAGGPPEKYFWVTGNLFDMVVDKIMYRDAIDEQRARTGTRCATKTYVQQLPTIRNLGC